MGRNVFRQDLGFSVGECSRVGFMWMIGWVWVLCLHRFLLCLESLSIKCPGLKIVMWGMGFCVVRGAF